MKFRKPTPIVWVKLDGTVTEGVLTSNLDFVPEDQRPTAPAPTKRGYKRLFCTKRNYWVSLYTKNILKV